MPAQSVFVVPWHLLVHVHVHVHVRVHIHRFHGPPFDYLGLAVGSGVSWILGIGPGEPLLIAAAVLASRHRLDLTELILIAWLGATAGGMIGWLIGLKAGRAVLVAPGPFQRARVRAVARGERVFHRRTVIAVILTPAWLAGVHRVKLPIFTFANAVSAAIWAIGIGGGAFLIGPAVGDIFDDLGTVGLVIIGSVIVLGGVAEVARRRIRAR